MNNNKSVQETLNTVLSSDAIYELCQLDQLIRANPEHEIYSRLREMISDSEVLTSVFNFAQKHPSGKRKFIFTGYLSSKEVMDVLSVSKRKLAEWRNAGLLPAKVFGNTFYYSVNDLVILLERNYTGKAAGINPT